MATNRKDVDVTILLLGETGVGKSTWINGFANFLQFETLDEAEQEPTMCLIPASFTITDDNYEERLISTGYDKNEVTEAGQSATQYPQSYLFPTPDGTVRLIDTPGIGDVRGVDQDKKNFELILDHISHLDNIHAICILLKPNNARLNIMFSFCIKELLTHLHKDACRNIVFCFTNSRSTFYRPGDTLPALRKLLEANDHVNISLDQSTLYCMDNEPIRFLYAMKDGIKFTPDERINYNSSWEKSVFEIRRLLQHAATLEPHSIQNTLSLNNARQTILALGSPMAEMSRTTQMNIVKKETMKIELATSQKSKEELSKDLLTTEYAVRMQTLPVPRTICTAVGCVEFIQVDDRKETIYKTHCHLGCGSGKQKHFKIANIVGHKDLKKCSAFDKKGNCRQCGCSYQKHMKITYETITEVRRITDIDKQIEIQNQENAIKKIEKYLEQVDIYINELRQEQVEITHASIEFARFLKSNAITPYNDSMDAYLMHFINEEQNKVAQGADPKVLEAMKKMRQDYKQQMAVLEKALEQGKNYTPVTPEELQKCVENLYKLKHSGKYLKDMMDNSLQSASSNYTEKVVERSASFTTTTTTTTTKTKSEKPRKKTLLSEIKDAFRSPGNTKEKKIVYLEPQSEVTGNSPRKSSFKPKKGEVAKRKEVFEQSESSTLTGFRKLHNDNKPQPVPTKNNPSLANRAVKKDNVTLNKIDPNNIMNKFKPISNIPSNSQQNKPLILPKRPPAPQPPPKTSAQPVISKPHAPERPFQVSNPPMPTNQPSTIKNPLKEINPPILQKMSKHEMLKQVPIPSPPPPPPTMPTVSFETELPQISKERSSLLEQIRQPHQLKKATTRQQAEANDTFQSTNKNVIPGYEDMNELLKRALSGRALRVQDTVEEEDDEWK